VTRALANHGRTIRIPAHLGGRISKLYQVAQELEQQYGRQPTAEEIAAEMELTGRPCPLDAAYQPPAGASGTSGRR
jgi:DNA-directed RNA polymerase sigma subunit (sigma70/sigma32)